jgi:acetylornithine deacetylase
MEQGSQYKTDQLYAEALELLKQLIATPSFSKEEEQAADLVECFFQEKNIKYERKLNNIWVKNRYFDAKKPIILLNSHLDTVKPNTAYTLNPFEPVEKDGKLFGLGSNDAGGSVVSLLATFLYFYPKKELKYNFIFAATAEEEVSGYKGIECILPELGAIDFAIVGEPTEMQLAVAEKGLLVVDCVAKGTASHAAHPNDDNAIYNALKDIEWFRTYQFPKKSKFLGEVKMTLSIINAGTQHNAIPDQCKFTIDVRVTDQYTNTEVLEIIKNHVKSDVTARSTRLNSSKIDEQHPFVLAGIALGRKTYGSPTTSDQAVIPFPSVKMGPGLSTRSHSADEFIYLNEIKEAIEIYIKILEKIN